jgi:hypothetical protein
MNQKIQAIGPSHLRTIFGVKCINLGGLHVKLTRRTALANISRQKFT